MAAGGVDPDEDVRLVVLPPPFMVGQPRQRPGRCASASARPGIRSRSIAASATSCISSPTSWCARRRRCWRSGRAGRRRNPEVVAALVRAAARGAAFIEHENRAEAARILAQPERIGVDAEVIQRTLDGRLKISPDGTMRESGRYLLVGREGADRPDPVQAAWLYAQMVRWGQTSTQPRGAQDRDGGVPARPLRCRAGAGQRSRQRAGRRLAPSPAPPSIPTISRGYLASFAVPRRTP